ncbi:MAG: hypothetical protein NUW21_08060 [Elusimicrobia bacterium]|nr:hypothetical protein [Elusimicrobiota bacterium]
MASIAVPQYFKVVEKGRFAEATSCFSVLKGAQERYYLKYSRYSNIVGRLDVVCPAGKAFAVPVIPAANTALYRVTLLRSPAAPAPYGSYTVTYIGPAGTLRCSQSNCTTDLLP